jgi:hypothetical protein
MGLSSKGTVVTDYRHIGSKSGDFEQQQAGRIISPLPAFAHISTCTLLLRRELKKPNKKKSDRFETHRFLILPIVIILFHQCDKIIKQIA